MSLSEIPSDLQQLLGLSLRAVRALLEALPQVFRAVWGFVARSVSDAVAPMLPALSHGQQDVLVTAAILVGSALAVFLAVQSLLLLMPSRSGAATRVRHRHR